MRAREWLSICLPALAAGTALWMDRAPQASVNAAQAEAPHSLGFLITFGLKNRAAGRVWSGGVRNPAQIRSLRGWHLGTGGLTPVSGFFASSGSGPSE